MSSSRINFGYAAFDETDTLVGFYKPIECRKGTVQWIFSKKERLLENSGLTEKDIYRNEALYKHGGDDKSCEKVRDLASLKQKLSKK